MAYRDHLRTNASTLEINEVLRSSPRVLLGVESFAIETLQSMGIHSVFDLASSSTFAGAEVIVRAAHDPEAPAAKVGRLPADLFGSPDGTALVDAPALDVDALRALPGVLAGNVREAFDIATIRELALWPPYVAARSILAEATGSDAPADEPTPGDLLPMSGRYATERAYYSTYVLADVDDPGHADKQALEDAGPLDPVTTLQGTGFSRPTRGARLTIAQSWYSEGVALGQLLHSLALAPGESTRVAMIDWSRQQSGMQREAEGADGADHRRHHQQAGVERGPERGRDRVAVGVLDDRGDVPAGAGGRGRWIQPRPAESRRERERCDGAVVRSHRDRELRGAQYRCGDEPERGRQHPPGGERGSRPVRLRRPGAVAVRARAAQHAGRGQLQPHARADRAVLRGRADLPDGRGLHRFEPCLFVPMRLVRVHGSGPGSFGRHGGVLVRRFRSALEARGPRHGHPHDAEPSTRSDGACAASAPTMGVVPSQVLPAEVRVGFRGAGGGTSPGCSASIVVPRRHHPRDPAECTLTGISLTSLTPASSRRALRQRHGRAVASAASGQSGPTGSRCPVPFRRDVDPGHRPAGSGTSAGCSA